MNLSPLDRDVIYGWTIIKNPNPLEKVRTIEVHWLREKAIPVNLSRKCFQTKQKQNKYRILKVHYQKAIEQMTFLRQVTHNIVGYCWALWL